MACQIDPREVQDVLAWPTRLLRDLRNLRGGQGLYDRMRERLSGGIEISSAFTGIDCFRMGADLIQREVHQSSGLTSNVIYSEAFGRSPKRVSQPQHPTTTLEIQPITCNSPPKTLRFPGPGQGGEGPPHRHANQMCVVGKCCKPGQGQQ
eukprot:6523445-Pyramimonas_sp.AAC.1